jgi:DNA polymerase (family X)
MPVVNAAISAIFDEIADLLDIQGANPFRVRAYRNAARTVGELGTDVKALVERGTALTEIPAIGEDLANKINEIVQTGQCEFLTRQRKQVPPAVIALLRVPGLGPKRVRILWRDLEIQTLEQLLQAAKDGRVRDLPGFGAKTEQKILESVQAHLGEARRFKLSAAAHYAEALAAYLRKVQGVRQVEVAGSFRRMKDTVGDLDMLAVAVKSSPVIARFARYEDVKEVMSSGPTRSTVILKNGIQVDLRVLPQESYGAALQYFTGSKAHNIVIRRMAQERGLKINEYGVFRGEQRVAGATEESVYAAVGLPWIPPELREDRGEIEAARDGKLPKLVELADLRGDLHAHSKAGDGHNTIGEMAQAARTHGLDYIAITDHSKRLAIAHGLDPAHLRKQIAETRKLNAGPAGITVLAGIEVDILNDGKLDLPDAILAEFDVVVAAVHSRFDLPRAQQTARILKALDNPRVHILAHPSGRVLEERETYDVDMEQLIHAARDRRVALELEAHPQRLDLIDTYCQMARQEGVPVAINSDAHNTFELAGLRFGVCQARRGWMEKRDVLNTRSLEDLRGWLRR